MIGLKGHQSVMAQYLKIHFIRYTNYVQSFMLLSKSAQFFAMPPHYGSVKVPLALKGFICDVVASLALHMSIAFCNVRSASLSSLPRVLSHIIPQTIRSLIKPSLRSPNSHVFPLVLYIGQRSHRCIGYVC